MGLVAVLIALLIAAGALLRLLQVAGRVAAIDASRAVACRVNRQNIERDITMGSVNHPDEAPTLAALQADGFRIPLCPEGGRYDIVGREVRCSKHR